MSLVPTNNGGSGGVVQAAPDAPCTEPLSGTAVEVYQPTSLSQLEEGERLLAGISTAPDAPKEVAEAAYRALSRYAHPDVGGSAEKQAVLNAAIEAVRAGT